MILTGIPIVHARTLNVDFRSKLLVRPYLFSDAEAEYCYKIALDSTIFRELAPKAGRIVFYAKSNYIVVGKTAVFHDLFSACGLQPQYDHVEGENGRYAYGFVGAVFKREVVNVPFIIGDEEILKIYISQITSRWNEEYGTKGIFDSHLSHEIDINVNEFIEMNNEIVPLLQHRNNKLVVDDTYENRKKILTAVYIIAKNGQDISLCTSLSTEKAIEKSSFDVVTCENASTIVLKNISDENKHIITSEFDRSQVNKKTSDNSKQLARYHVPNGFELENHQTQDIVECNTDKFLNNGSIYNKLTTTKSKKVKSFDDILEESVAPSKEDARERLRFSSSVSGSTSLKKSDIKEEIKNITKNIMKIGPVLGIISGVLFVVLEMAIKAKPTVLIITGVFTIVFIGLEAKIIIERFKN